MKRLITSLFLGLAVYGGVQASPAVSLSNLTVEGRQAPLGLDERNPRLGWRIEGDKEGILQRSYRIIVASSKEKAETLEGDVFDSGNITSEASQWVSLPATISLQPNKEYFWRVRVKTNKGDTGWSKTEKWSTGLLSPDNWKGEWIGTDSLMPGDDASKFSKVTARYLRKEFRVAKKVRRATVHVSGMGIYTIDINGKRPSDDVLTPVGTDFLKTIAYDTYDVTSLIKAQNAILLTLEAGNYFAVRQQYQANVRDTYGMPRARMNLIIEYEDGTQETVATDTSWKMTCDGPVRYANYYDGEMYDARKEFSGASLPGFDDSKWQQAQAVKVPKGTLKGNISPNMHVYATNKPVEIKKVGDRTIIDFGTNGAGRARLKIRAAKGDTVVMKYAEQLNKDGKSLYTKNLRAAQCTDYYISNGTAAEWTSEYVYHGFRFMEVKGTDIGEGDIVRELIADRMDDSDDFFRTDGILQNIIYNARRGIRDNYKGMPLDCPQRDERMPWLGDRAMGCYGESYMMDNHALYAKWVKDICDSQKDNGAISDVSPAYWKLYNTNITWPAALPLACDMLNRQYGDDRPVKGAYGNIKKFLKYVKGESVKDGLFTYDRYGDWCLPPEDPKLIHSKDSTRITDGSLLATAYYFYLCKMMAGYGEGADKEYFEAEAENAKEAFNRKFLSEGNYANGTATSNLLPLAMGIVPDDQRQAVHDNLIRNIVEKCQGHISCGVIGIQWLMRYLSESGRGDVAYRMATMEDYPGWGYMVRQGATTIWELWNGDTANPAMNSGNHVMLLGDLLTWCYEYLGGIRPASPGFKEILLQPDFSIKELNNVECSHRSPYGVIKSKWSRGANGKITWEVTVPPNTTATVVMPNGKKKQIGSGKHKF